MASLLGIEVSESQVYRTCQRVSAQLEAEALCSPSEALEVLESEANQEVYGMVDGSMLFTDEGWQETKLGRVFTADLIEHKTHRWQVNESQYVAKRGHYESFTAQFEQLLPPQSECKKIFVTDGALWISNWIKATYHSCVHILDFFHVLEKVAEAKPKDTQWLELQKKDLLASRTTKVINRIKLLPNSKCFDNLIGYLEKNQDKMNYKYYREKGWMIGSGPIESAHRTVLQVRMKRSGIRWANHGCDNMIKLRVAYMNNNGNAIRDVLKSVA
ncbi:MAG TPA: UPF0236 family protein [Saprospiraceae bacterium]|nr:UPF0236 family protein [Saprospiraceae bacterium]